MLLHKSVEHDGRVQREARALAQAGHRVTVIHLPPGDSGTGRGRGPTGEPQMILSSATPRRWWRRWASIGRCAAALNMVRLARAEAPDVVHAHDAAMLVPAYLASRLTRSGLVYDSHEYATGVPYRGRAWASLVASIERLLIGRCDAVITVSDGIAERLRGRYGLDRDPAVVRNVPDLAPLDGSGDLRERLGMGDRPLILHQGAVAPGRGCEALVRAMPLVAEAHLLFLGAEGGYAERLRDLAGELDVGGRVQTLPPVPLTELLSTTAQADVGVSLLEDSCENHRLALPNKVFEYVAAGVPVVVSALPELERLRREYGIGWAVDPSDPAAIAASLRIALRDGRDPDVRERLRRARSELNWERERQKLLAVYSRLEAQ